VSEPAAGAPASALLVLANGDAAPGELDRYAALERFAARELELAGRGEVNDLESHAAGWDSLVEGLPENPPADAGPMLERATLLHERARVELLRLREALLSELATVGQAARAAHGYAPAGAKRPRLDRSA
jgi:hypothetical protein